MSAEARALFDCLSLSYLRYRIFDLSTVASHRLDLICLLVLYSLLSLVFVLTLLSMYHSCLFHSMYQRRPQ